MDEVVAEFLVESHENLDRIDADLLALEDDPGRPDLLASVFRSVHTIKGTCGFLGFAKLERVTHVGESLLSRLRDRQLVLTPELATALLRMVDAVRLMLASVESTGRDGDVDWSDLVAELERLQQPQAASGEAPADAAADGAATVEAAEPATVAATSAGRAGAPAAPLVSPPSGDVAAAAAVEPVAIPSAEADEGSGDRLGEILVRAGATNPEEVTLANLAQHLGDDRRIGEVLVEEGAVSPEDVTDALATQREQRSAVSDGSIRVDVGLLDDLMNLVSELVLARNQILQHSAGGESLSSGTFQRLNLITTELQEAVMKTRMQPIRNVWSKFPRVVRDLALACNKQVRVEMDGEQTELDKTIVEAIRDPLTHVVRNAVDHGIETPARRMAAGKPAEGRLWLRAFHESGHVNIEIADDGAGIDPQKVAAKAVEKGLVSPERSRQLSDRELLNLIFTPGFSTAETVTNVSGRGVGMDVVKTNIEKIGGSVDIHSEMGRGTTLKVKIPLTLAIIPALVVTCSEQRYAIPQVNLVELVRLEAGQAAGAVEDIHGTPVYRLRGRLLPLVSLQETLGLPPRADATRAVSIVVLQVDDRTFGLVVDEVNDTEEIVVKALGTHVKDIDAFAGATIMGDGRVALILDVLGLARQAGVVGEQRTEHGASLDDTDGAADRQTSSFLLVATADGRHQLAIPLAAVARLEEFPAEAVERAGHRPVVRYNDRILPLVDLSSVVGADGDPLESRGRLQVVVHGHGQSSVGLVVDRLVDIVEEHVEVQAGVDAGHGALAGAAIIRGGVTDLVDIDQVLADAGLAGISPEAVA